MHSARRSGVLLLGLMLGAGCSTERPIADSADSRQPTSIGKTGDVTQRSLRRGASSSRPQPAATPHFENVAAESGIDFQYFSDAVPGRYFLPEVMGGGAGWIDFDRDGLLDLYLLDGARLKDPDPAQTDRVNRLYRQAAGGQFRDVSLLAAAADNGYGQGCAIGDYDGDGFDDLYITNYGANVLLHNQGDGTFTNVTARAGVGDAAWGTSALWVDLDDDADLDLYVANYLDVTLENLRVCTYNNVPGYCGPGEYEAQADVVYLNQGNGTFEEAPPELGFRAEGGKGLAVVALDFDHDLQPEIYVANDMMPNFLFTRGAATSLRPDQDASTVYADLAALGGSAVSDVGQNEASMGIACADFDGDGMTDIFLTHYYLQKNTLYRNLGGLLFQDDSRRTRIAAMSFATLGFGTLALDYDRDADADLFISNGHVLGPLHQPNAMSPQLWRNDGQAMFEEVSAEAGAYFAELFLGRGVAGADYDNDGDPDIVVTHLDQPVALLRNDTAVKGRDYIGLDLYTVARHLPVGGRVVVYTPGRRLVVPVMTGGSYLSSSDRRLLVGLGATNGYVDLEVHWPSGMVQQLDHVRTNAYWRIDEGKLPRPSATAAQMSKP